MRYIGRWYEVASIKRGFAGEGQQDCHCTQGVYLPKEEGDGTIRLQANTFCVHGSPTGRISGIQGQVTCANPQLLQLLPEFETPLEREEDIVEKCVLRFPSIPFIPAEPYDVVRSDYSSYAIVQGASDRSFVQIYSRTPNPGPEFMEERMATLKELGYDLDELRITPQDCPVVPMEKLMAAMPSGSMMDSMMTNTMPPDVKLAAVVGAPEAPDLKGGIQFSAFGNPLTTLKDLVKLGSGSSS